MHTAWQRIPLVALVLLVPMMISGGENAIQSMQPKRRELPRASLAQPLLRSVSARLSGEDIMSIAQHVGLTEEVVSLPKLMHYLRFLPEQSRARDDVLRIILDEDQARKVFNGRSGFVRTKRGIRCRVTSERANDPECQAHTDQLLAVLSEVGVDLRTPVCVGGEALQVRDILKQTICDFDLAAKELDWTAIALVNYFTSTKGVGLTNSATAPPSTSWRTS